MLVGAQNFIHGNLPYELHKKCLHILYFVHPSAFHGHKFQSLLRLLGINQKLQCTFYSTTINKAVMLFFSRLGKGCTLQKRVTLQCPERQSESLLIHCTQYVLWKHYYVLFKNNSEFSATMSLYISSIQRKPLLVRVILVPQ